MDREKKLKELEKMGWSKQETRSLILELSKLAHDRKVVPEELALRCAIVASGRGLKK